MTPMEFVNSDLLVDSSEGEILPEKAMELAEEIGKKVVNTKAVAAASALTELHDAYEARQKQQEDGTEPASKKAKSVDNARLDAYGKYKDMKVAGLGDICQWNRQYKSGGKAFLMGKVIDGEVYGRFQLCPLCGGKHLKLREDCTTVICHGVFDEGSQRRLVCAYQAKPSEAPRWKPWYVQSRRR
jgi:hypothetical protein